MLFSRTPNRQQIQHYKKNTARSQYLTLAEVFKACTGVQANPEFVLAKFESGTGMSSMSPYSYSQLVASGETISKEPPKNRGGPVQFPGRGRSALGCLGREKRGVFSREKRESECGKMWDNWQLGKWQALRFASWAFGLCGPFSTHKMGLGLLKRKWRNDSLSYIQKQRKRLC